MTILSDTEIADLCVLPEARFNQAVYESKMAVLNTTSMVTDDEYYAAEKRIKEDSFIPVSQKERDKFVPMINPFIPHQVREYSGPAVSFDPDQIVEVSRKIISRGLSSYGYDVVLAPEFKLFTNINSTIVDPKRLDDKCLVDAKIHTDSDGAQYVIMPPNSYLLGRTVECFHIPSDVMVIALGKSTYARAGAIVNVTPIEPGFSGNVVIEISNATSLPMKIYAYEGISQFVFFRGNKPAAVTYGDRNGKYQGQTGITMPKV